MLPSLVHVSSRIATCDGCLAVCVGIVALCSVEGVASVVATDGVEVVVEGAEAEGYTRGITSTGAKAFTVSKFALFHEPR